MSAKVEYTIVNGPEDGQVLTLSHQVEDGTTLTVPTFQTSVKKREVDDRMWQIHIVRKFHVCDQKAYYVGEVYKYTDMVSGEVVFPTSTNW